jgi:hypothetical protein
MGLEESVVRRDQAHARLAAWIIGSALAGLTLLLLVRRIGGWFEIPLGPPALLGLGVVFALAWAAVLMGEDRFRAPLSGRVAGATTAAVLLLLMALGVLIPGTGALGGVGLLAPSLGAMALWMTLAGRDGGLAPLAAPAWPALRVPTSEPDHGHLRMQPLGRVRTAPIHTAPRRTARSTPAAASRPARHVTQRLRRERGAQGQDHIEAELTAPVQVGERTVQAHVAFCPPFEQLPEVQVEQVAGPQAELRIAQRLAHGVRIECKLNRPAASAEPIRIRLTANSG